MSTSSTLPGAPAVVCLPSTGDADEVTVQPLGSGGEVGRSCILLSHNDRNVMLDCGVHPAKSGLDSLPFFDTIDCSTVDLVLVTHFHLDHCAALPYLLEQTNFRGRVFMTSSTKAFYKMVMSDFVKIGTSAQDVVTPEWLHSTLDRIETIEYHQEKLHGGVRFTAYNAGHVLGAAMFLVEIAGIRCLYTGDYSRAPDRHLLGAEIPLISPDILIVESTYGIQVHETREERESKLTGWVQEIVGRGGRCLIPVFALGRAQELLLVLEEFWANHRDLQHIPIYYASSLATRCMKLYHAFINDMNDRVRAQHDANINPFDFRFISSLKDLTVFDDSGPCVVLASPGMLQSGVSLDLFERWCGDSRNGIIIAGYCVDGTLAKEVLKKPREVTKEDGRVLAVRMGSIHTVSFSAHSDARQTTEFIQQLQGTRHVVLVHGNEDAMGKLQKKLTEDFASRGMHVYNTKNTEKIVMSFKRERTARLLGSIAQRSVNPGDLLQGVLLVSGDARHTIVAPEDVATFTGIAVCRVEQAITVPVPRHVALPDILRCLQSYFAGCAVNNGAAQQEGGPVIIDAPGGVRVQVQQGTDGQGSSCTVVWRSSHHADLIADVVCVALVEAATASDEEIAHEDLAQDSAIAPLPVETASEDRALRLKCLHQFLAHHYCTVTTDLGASTCVVTAADGERLRVVDFTDVVNDETGSRPSEANYKACRELLRRIYLTLFAVPLENGWCECGQHH